MYRIAAFTVLLLLVSAYAAFRGGGTERATALTFLVAFAVSRGVALVGANNFEHVEWIYLSIDLAVLLSLSGIAAWSDQHARKWLTWCIAIQSAAVFIHLGRVFSGADIMNWAYYVLAEFGAYPMLLILAFGTWRSIRLRKTPRSSPSF